MLMLTIAVACSVTVSILLKLARHFSLDVTQAVWVNYLVASGLTLYVLQPAPDSLPLLLNHWPLMAALGLLLPGVFLLMAAAVNQAGIARSDAAQRLSLVLPLLASFVLFQQPLAAGTLAGLILALIAMVALIQRNGPRQTSGPAALWLLPAVWAGYGVIDICFKQMARAGSGFSSVLLGSFVLAGVTLGLWLLLRKSRWHLPSLAGGLLLGAFNFGNIYAYISAHRSLPDNPALVFTSMNIGVILCGSLVGVLLFREKLSRTNVAGMLLAAAAVLLLMPRPA